MGYRFLNKAKSSNNIQKFTKPDVSYAKLEKNSEEPVNPNDEIMSKDTCYLTGEEVKCELKL